MLEGTSLWNQSIQECYFSVQHTVATFFHHESQKIPYGNNYMHLGVVRNRTNQLNTDDRIEHARTLYALMGAGVHGKVTVSMDFTSYLVYLHDPQDAIAYMAWSYPPTRTRYM